MNDERAVVSVATGRYIPGLLRLRATVEGQAKFFGWEDLLPGGSPSHIDKPYAFKAFALDFAARQGAKVLLWADASILPIKPLEELFDRIERDGYWISNNGWTNYEWTADQAYAALGISREANRLIPHVVATTFGVSFKNAIGRAIFDMYHSLALGNAFVGPWANKNHPDYAGRQVDHRCAPCGPADVRGHRHDQTALSVVAHRVGAVLTNAPEIFAYRGGETAKTFLVADSNY